MGVIKTLLAFAQRYLITNMSQINDPLKVAVVGAGIGGLSAAIALRNVGHAVTVYEKYPSAFTSTTSPLSNAIALGANINRIIDKWGFDFPKAKPGVNKQERVFHGETLQQLHHIDFKYNREEFGYDWLLMRRQALHEGLLSIAMATPSMLLPIDIRMDQEVIALSPEKGALTLREGREVVSDLVVVADGVHSKLIDTITNNTTPPLRAGRTAYRFKISREQIMADPDLRALYEKEDEGMSYFQIPEKRIYFLVIQADGGESWYGLLIHPAIATNIDAIQKYNVEGSKTELQKLAENLHPTVRKLCNLAATPLLWTICCREPLTSCVNGRAVAIGDACHPHLPSHGQGAAAAAEDAASLGVFLSGIAQPFLPTKVPAALQQWESFRLPRAIAVQLITIRFPTPIEELESKIRALGYDDRLPANVNSHERAITQWLFEYNVVAEATKCCEKIRHS
ncbi:Salicylate 1-monooxygenase [Ascochyta rabiei]|uniref:Salicylate 1-monooxygenase n=1 Tax=Didymella rabiei TaxID=5454 RepID=UPI00220DE154|nr:Salicylate 1-monooxygenase [Ascochyta rabiei]UPX10224.1 Salicylate 1-monooxygenase [Ascochyta rabiei]